MLETVIDSEKEKSIQQIDKLKSKIEELNE